MGGRSIRAAERQTSAPCESITCFDLRTLGHTQKRPGPLQKFWHHEFWCFLARQRTHAPNHSQPSTPMRTYTHTA